MLIKDSFSDELGWNFAFLLPEEHELQFESGKFGSVRSYPSGTELLQQGTFADAVYFIRDGLVKLVWNESRGKESIVGLRRRGWFLGVPSVITSSPCPASAIALTRSVVERISVDQFLFHLHANANLAWKVLQIQSQEICEQITWLGELACCSARIRLLNVLQRLRSSSATFTENRNCRFRLPLKRKDLAELIAVTPEHLSRLLNELSREGQITLSKDWILISDDQHSRSNSDSTIDRRKPRHAQRHASGTAG